MIRAGILGFGVAGRYFHAPLLQATNIDIAAVVSSRRDVVAETLPRAAVLASEAELLARPDIDLVVIATPNHLHEPQARAALAAGKHVVVDKPMCIHAKEADGLIELARRHGRMLAAFQNRRWDSDFLTIKKLVAEDRLGALHAFNVRWDRYRPTVVDRWREHELPGNGMVYDLGAHLIDQALQLFGVPDWIHADLFTQRDGAKMSDGFAIHMAAGNARINLGVSLLIAEGGPRYGLHGAKGSYVKYGLDVQEAQLRAGMSAAAPEFGVEPQSQWGQLTDGASGRTEVVPAERGRWTEFYARVRACIETGAAPPVSGESSRDVIRVVEAAMESSATGRRVAL